MFKLPDRLRDELKDPLGEIISEEALPDALPEGSLVIAVGDMVAYTLYRKHIEPHLTIIDFHTQRDSIVKFKSELKKLGERVLRVRNPKGQITRELWEAIKDALASDSSVRIEVDGEEDLATIPCVMLAPNGALLLYGLWNRGIVLVEIGASTRKRVENALKFMEV